MKIAAVMNAHSQPDIVKDTLESVQTYMTEDVLIVVDGSSKSFPGHEMSVPMINGFRHNVARSPFRNMALGLMSVVDIHPDSDWYCYIEYDCLVASSRFCRNLEMADERGVWMLGNDGHVDEVKMPLIESLLGEKLRGTYYLLGACQFFSKKFMDKLESINFFQRFLNLTNEFCDGLFPHYDGYDINEHMYPTLCRQFGGNIGVFATYDYTKGKWHGSYEIFPVRWKPDLDPADENFAQASIIHPLKTFDHPIREHHRRIRHAIRSTPCVWPGARHFGQEGQGREANISQSSQSID